MKGVVILDEYIEGLRKLSQEELGQLMKAILDDAAGEEPDLEDASLTVEILYPIMQASIDRVRETSEKKSEAGKRGGRPKKGCALSSGFENEKAVVSENEKPIPNHTMPNETKVSPGGDTRAKRFVPPTVDEVKAYAREKGLRVDAERFVAFYESNGWMVGKNKMQNWRAAMSGWGARDKKEHPPNREDGFAVDLSEIDYTRLLRKEASG